jgi:hypothetical protein
MDLSLKWIGKPETRLSIECGKVQGESDKLEFVAASAWLIIDLQVETTN